MSRRKTDGPSTARAEIVIKHGRKPEMKECAVVDKAGKVDWERTTRDFPIRPKGGRG